jgi:hypothetical protein
MSITENVCLVCNTKNELEAVVCGNCGATLEDPFMDPGAKTKTTDMQALTPEEIRDWLIDENAVPDTAQAGLYRFQRRICHGSQGGNHIRRLA